MKERLLKAWHDTVWSKVIAGAILGVSGLLIVKVKSLIEGISFTEVANTEINIHVSLGRLILYCVAIVIGVLIILDLIKRINNSLQQKKYDELITKIPKFINPMQESYFSYEWNEFKNTEMFQYFDDVVNLTNSVLFSYNMDRDIINYYKASEIIALRYPTSSDVYILTDKGEYFAKMYHLEKAESEVANLSEEAINEGKWNRELIDFMTSEPKSYMASISKSVRGIKPLSNFIPGNIVDYYLEKDLMYEVMQPGSNIYRFTEKGDYFAKKVAVYAVEGFPKVQL